MAKTNLIPLALFSVAVGLVKLLFSASLVAQENFDSSNASPVEARLHSIAKQQEQEIELLDREGRKIKGRLSLVLQNQDDQAKLMVVQPGGEKGDRPKAKMVDNQVVILAEDGSEKIIQPQRIFVTQSQRTTIEDGQEKTEIIQQAIVTDAEGNQYEVELPANDRNLPGFVRSRPLASLAFSQAAVEKFMIGVQLEPVTESLAAQLNLEPGVGLMVNQVTPGSPAANAGVQVYDILLYADDSSLRSVSDLAGLIQTSGQAGEAINLVLIRGGKEQSVAVQPIERTGDRTLLGIFGEGAEGIGPIDMDNFPKFNFQQAGPGIVLDGGVEMDSLVERLKKLELTTQQRAEQLRKTVEELPDVQVFRQQTQKMVEEMRQRAKEFENQSQTQAQEMRELMRNMRLELEELRKLRNRDDQ